MIRDDLLAATRAAPGDDTRLIYADFLEQHDELPRAMLVRLQCELAGVPAWDRRHVEATWEVEALLAEHGQAWRAELPVLDGVAWTEFARGFPSAVRVKDVETLVRHAAAIIAAAPIACVELKALDEAQPFPSDEVTWIETLRLRYAADHRAHARRSILSAVDAIEIVAGEEMEAAALEWLALRTTERPLRCLAISGPHTIGLAFVRQLIAAPWVASLERLELGTAFVDWDSGYFNDPSMLGEGADLLASAKLDRITALDVTHQRLGPDGLRLVIESLPRLRDLRARGCDATTIDVLARAGTPIVRLDLSENPLGRRGATVLAASPRLGELEALALDLCELRGAGVAALTHAPFWSTLQTLDLGRNPLGLDGVVALLAAPVPARLHTLRLADIDLTPEAATLLGDLPWLRATIRIDLSTNPLPRGVLDAIGAGVARDVALATCAIADPAPLAPLWERAVHLDLRDNPIGDVGFDALVTSAASTLQTLDLRGCNLTANAIAILVERARLPRLRTLVLRDNPIGAPGLARLVNSELARTLEMLDLGNCGLSDDIVPVLAAAPGFARLHTLRLLDNEVSPEAGNALARVASLRTIPRINLRSKLWSIEYVGDEDDVRADAQRAYLAAQFGETWWCEREPRAEIPAYYRQLRERRLREERQRGD